MFGAPDVGKPDDGFQECEAPASYRWLSLTRRAGSSQSAVSAAGTRRQAWTTRGSGVGHRWQERPGASVMSGDRRTCHRTASALVATDRDL